MDSGAFVQIHAADHLAAVHHQPVLGWIKRAYRARPVAASGPQVYLLFLPHSFSASRFTAGAAGFLTLIQSSDFLGPGL
jgi:hypothetical protein